MARRTHRCPACAKHSILREHREGVVERSVLGAAGFRLYRCRTCGHRFYDQRVGRRASSPSSPAKLPAPLQDQRGPLASCDTVNHRLKRVLVIEDDAEVRDLLIDVLSEHGYETFAVADGGPAITLLEQTAMDLILLDLFLKTIHGFEVLARVWARPTTARVPVIVISGLVSAVEPVLHRKVVDVLEKPLNVAHLMESVRRATLGASA